ncbi:Fc.00g068420.m01.CDS01 [Cosmosporella sp. VM-42]
MLATRRLLQACRITLFTRENCGLCVQARSVLSDVWDKRPFDFKEIDIVKPAAKAWKDLYDFDVPVVS